MRRSRIAAALVGAAAMMATALPAAAAGPDAEFQVTVYNLTESGQWFTPPVVVAHRPAVDLFEVGEPANEAIRQIAENGNLGPAVDFAGSSRHVLGAAVLAGSPPPLAPGDSISGELTAQMSATRLSFASMLICTNDGFTGVDSVRLPRHLGHSVTVYASAYDAGTEINTEDWDDLVPPCAMLTGFGDQGGTGMSNPALAENGVISKHPGIQGGEDLIPSVHDWDNPVAKIVVTRTR